MVDQWADTVAHNRTGKFVLNVEINPKFNVRGTTAMNEKRKLFQSFHARLESEIDSGRYFEASWYIYALLEDRAISLLENSGGIPQPKSGSFLMLGAKVKHLKKRCADDQLLASCFDPGPVRSWITDRNNLMHGMANGSLTLAEIDKMKFQLATKGQELIKDVSAGAMRLKKHRDKVEMSNPTD